MQQHPIPQQISSYEFRLVGDMTLKQFIKLAGGLLVAFMIYSSGLPGYFRWPLVILSGLLGVASAFMPFHDRPLETWILAYFKKTYLPTIFIWGRQTRPVFTPSSSPVAPAPKAKKIEVENKMPKLREFVGTIKTQKAGGQPNPFSQPEPAAASNQAAISDETLAKVEEALKEPRPKNHFRQPEFEETPMPATPTIANVINGLVLDDKGKIIEGAIVEIQDIEANPIRAMRTNRLGQFQTATPLSNGTYLIIAEREPFQFDIIKIEARGEVIAPIKVKAKPGAVA